MTRSYLSWSEVSAWLNCQLAWHFHYTEGLRNPRPPDIYLQMGTAAHGLLQTHVGVRQEVRSKDRLDKEVVRRLAALDLSGDDKAELRRPQLEGFAAAIWDAWGSDDELPQLVTETVLQVPVAGETREYRCIPDAWRVAGELGLVMSHKTALSSMPDIHRLVAFHPQARLEAWTLAEAFHLKEVEIWFNTVTPKLALREGPLLYGAGEHAATTLELKAMFAQVGRLPIVPRTGPHCYRCPFHELHSTLVLGGDPEEARRRYKADDGQVVGDRSGATATGREPVVEN